MKSIATVPVMICLVVIVVAKTTPPSSSSSFVVAGGAAAAAAMTGTAASRTLASPVASSSGTTTSTRTPATSTATSSTSDYYESVRQLDRYGNSIQLRHAAQAALQHGRLVVAVSLPTRHHHQRDCVVLLCTPISNLDSPVTIMSQDNDEASEEEEVPPRQQQQQQQQHQEKDDVGPVENDESRTGSERTTSRSHHHDRLHFTSRGIQRRRVVSSMTSKDPMRPSRLTTSSSPPLARIVSIHHDPSGGGSPTPSVAIVTSGLAADARFVHQHVWEAAKLAFDKYNAELQGPAVLHELQALYRNFWGYPTSAESWDWRSRGGGNDNDDGASDWTRPLGVTTLVVQLSSDDAASSSEDPPPAQLYVMEPSGIVQQAPHIQLISDDDSGATTPTTASIACIGKDSSEVQKRLEKLLRAATKDRTTVDDAIQLIADAIRGPASRPYRGDDGAHDDRTKAKTMVSSSTAASLYVEILTVHGEVERRIVPM